MAQMCNIYVWIWIFIFGRKARMQTRWKSSQCTHFICTSEQSKNQDHLMCPTVYLHCRTDTSTVIISTKTIMKYLWNDEQSKEIFSVGCSAARDKTILLFLEWIMSDYSHQLIMWKLPFYYQKTKICIGGNSLQTFLLNIFKHLNLPLPLLLFSLPIWKDLHLPSCHHTANRENRCVVIKILNYTFYVEKFPNILVYLWFLSPTTIRQKGTL